MEIYQNEEYEVCMPDTEYESISSQSNAAYEYMRPQLIRESLQRKNEAFRPQRRGAYMLLGCVIGLLIGTILGGATTVVVMQYNGDQKSVISGVNAGAYTHEGTPANRAVKVDASPNVATRESLFSTKDAVTDAPRKTTKSTQYTPPINTEGASPNKTVKVGTFPSITSEETLLSTSDAVRNVSTNAKNTPYSSTINADEGISSTRYVGSTVKPETTSEEDDGTTIVITSPPLTRRMTSRHTKPEFPCGIRIGAVCYAIEVSGEDIMDFAMAQLTCQTLGGRVARIPSERAYKAVTEKMRTLNPHRNRWVTAWIGLQIDPKTGTPSSQGTKDFVKWGPFEPNTGQKFIHHTHVYIYADKYDLKYVGMRNLSPDRKRDGVICQDGVYKTS